MEKRTDWGINNLYSEIMDEVSSEVNRLTTTITRKLTNKWATTYEPSIHKENMKVLPELEVTDLTKEKINKFIADLIGSVITRMKENSGIKNKEIDRNTSDSYTKIMSEVSNEINRLTISTIEELKNDWTIAYERSVCEENIKVLTGHVHTFYNEIKEETKEKINKLSTDINDLKEEAAYLGRLLKIDVPLQIDKRKPLFTIKFELNESLNGLREMLEERKNNIIELHAEENLLCNELDIKDRRILIDNLDETLPSTNDLISHRKYLDDLYNEKNNRANEINRLRNDIKRQLKDLEIYEISDEDRSLLNDPVPLSLSTINKLRLLHKFYIAQMDNMKIEIDNMKLKLQKLWNYFDTDSKHRKKFDKYSDKCTQKAFEMYYNELERCEIEKKKHIAEFIKKIRTEICELWELCLTSETEQKRFTPYKDDSYSDKLLELHENKLEELKAFYEENKKIFQKYEERCKLWNQMVTLEAQANEPNRWNNRGGKLLQEEKERKEVSKKLPKIEEELKELVLEYENKNNRKFTVRGEDLIEVINKQWEKKNEEKKEKMMSARKNITAIRTPLSVKNQHTYQSAMTPSTKNITTARGRKRQSTEKDGFVSKARKQLLAVSPASMQQSPKLLSKSNLKMSVQKRVIVTSINKRNSGRLSNNKKNHKRSRSNKKIPDIVVSDETLQTDSTSYDLFKQRVDPSTRSSGLLEIDASNDSQEKAVIAAATTTTADNPRMTRSHTKFRSATPKKPRQNIYTRSPIIRKLKTSTTAITTSDSPKAGPSSNRKLVVKDVPILF